jgi:cytochrome bd-type quinol oxidase subunit 2
MILDHTMQLAPIFWGMVALLLLLAGAILASVDPEIAEAYLGDPRLLVASAVMAVALMGVLVVSQPEVAHGLISLWPGG